MSGWSRRLAVSTLWKVLLHIHYALMTHSNLVTRLAYHKFVSLEFTFLDFWWGFHSLRIFQELICKHIDSAFWPFQRSDFILIYFPQLKQIQSFFELAFSVFTFLLNSFDEFYSLLNLIKKLRIVLGQSLGGLDLQVTKAVGGGWLWNRGLVGWSNRQKLAVIKHV